MNFQIPFNFNNIIFAQNIITGIGYMPVNFHFPGVNPHTDSCISFGVKKFNSFSAIEEQVILFYDDGDMKAPNKGFLLTTKGMHILGYPWFIPMERLIGSNIQLTKSQFGFDLTMYYPEGVSPVSDTYKIYVPNDMLIPVLRMIMKQLASSDPMAPVFKERRIKKFCTSCGTKLLPGAKFCQNCGIKLYE